MSWLDILEGLSAGGSRALEQYGSMKQAERDRAEREKQRQEDIAYRQRMMDLQERQFAASEARALEERNRRIQEAINKGELTKAQERLNLDAIRESMPEAEDIGDARSLFTGAGMGMAAQKAPGQTYAAQKMREESPSALVRPSMSFIDEVPEFEPRETYMERGTTTLGDQAFRPTTRAEITAMGAEAEELEMARERERRARDVEGIPELSDYQKRYYILTGTIPAPEREAAAPSLPTSIQELQQLRAMFPDMSEDELLARAGLGLPAVSAPAEPTLPTSTMEKVALNRAITESGNEILNLIGTGAERGVGLRMKIPGMQRTGSPEEIMFRAQVANIGSSLLAARSGAAISAQEFERLSPFIPSVSDNIEKIRANIISLNRELNRINRSYYETAGVTPPSYYDEESYEAPSREEFSISGPLSDDDILNELYGPASGGGFMPLNPFRDTGNIIFRD